MYRVPPLVWNTLVDIAIHQFDAVRFLLNQDPVSVYCEEFNPSWGWYGGAAAATALVGPP